MDLIFLKDWAGFFKFFIYVLYKIEKKILKMDYDKIL